MNWEELKAAAATILANTPSGDYQDLVFKTGSGGISIKAPVKVLHQEQSFAYETVANGNAYKHAVAIRCRSTGAVDADRLQIYEDENGTLFVFKYNRGSPYNFDSGSIKDPKMN